MLQNIYSVYYEVCSGKHIEENKVTCYETNIYIAIEQKL